MMADAANGLNSEHIDENITLLDTDELPGDVMMPEYSTHWSTHWSDEEATPKLCSNLSAVFKTYTILHNAYGGARMMNILGPMAGGDWIQDEMISEATR